jgi:galactokinase
MLEKCKAMMTPIIFNRCKYVVDENIRVQEGALDLQNRDLAAFGEKMYRTHEGLSQLYEVSCDELDFLVEITKPYEGISGSRMMGGGFGGCTLNIIESNLVGTFINYAKKSYKERFNKELSYHIVKTGNGATIFENPFA